MSSPDAPDDADLAAFVAAGPSPFHVVAEMARRLEAAGFSRIDERDDWEPLTPGAARYVVRDGGSLVAFRVGTAAPADAGFRIVGAHTDSPTLKVRPHDRVERFGYLQVGVEPYGGGLWHTWLDRDLGVAGRVALRSADGGVQLRPVDLAGPLLRIPNLAIHLDRSLNEALKLNAQQHLVPVLAEKDASGLRELVAAHVGVAPDDILGHDLVLADSHPPAAGGPDGQWLFAPRLDNLSSCHAGTSALIAAEDGQGPATQVLVANDHEEVGSASAEGAAGSFLSDVLLRVVAATTDGAVAGGAVALRRAAARSLLVSCDTAHAVHPNYGDRHEASHRPRPGAGPVIKVNANQRYATDAGTGGWFAARCREVGVEPQYFVTRGDLPCGSTIGPLTATRTGVSTVDVGIPILSMHSIREQCALADVDPMIRALGRHLSAEQRPPA